MKISPKDGILVIKKHRNTAYKSDIAIIEDDADKRLITGEIIQSSENSNFKVGQSIIFGKYALFMLTIKGEDFYLLSEDDVIGFTDYKE